MEQGPETLLRLEGRRTACWESEAQKNEPNSDMFPATSDPSYVISRFKHAFSAQTIEGTRSPVFRLHLHVSRLVKLSVKPLLSLVLLLSLCCFHLFYFTFLHSCIDSCAFLKHFSPSLTNKTSAKKTAASLFPREDYVLPEGFFGSIIPTQSFHLCIRLCSKSDSKIISQLCTVQYKQYIL